METTNCGPCKTLNKNKKALKWCVICEEALCIKCTESHQAMKISRNHQLVEVDKIPPNITSPSCSEHKNLPFEYFCIDHDGLCCKECLAVHHRACQKVMSVDVASQEVKRSQALEDMVDTIDNILKTIEKFKTKRTEDISTLEESAQQVKTEIKIAKEKIVKYIENLEKSLLEELQEVKDEYMLKLEEDINTLTDVENTTVEKKKVIEMVKNHGSKPQIFCTVHASKKILRDIENKIESLKEVAYSPRLKFSDYKEFTMLEVLGNLKVEEIPSPVKFIPKNKLQSQFPVLVRQELSNFGQEGTINIYKEHNGALIIGLTFTEDNMLLTCDYKTPRIIVFDNNDIYKHQIKTKYIPWDIATLPNRDMAVATSQSHNYLQFIDLKKLNIYKVVSFADSKMSGIETNCDNIFVGGTHRIYVLGHEGRELRRIKTDKTIGKIWSLSLSKSGNIYGSGETMVVCLQPNGKELFTYHPDNLTEPRNLTTDEQDNLYIPGRLSNNIHRIKPDGTCIDIKLEEKDGINYPLAVCFNKQHTKCYVSNENGSEISIFKAS